MPKFKHILFPIDFSAQNCRIAPYVAEMATHYGSNVTLLHVFEMPTGAYPGWPAYGPLVDLQALVSDRQKRADSFLKPEFRDIATTRVMLEGDPARSIADYAEKENVDLIMMPTHGYGPFRRFLLGSITAKILHDVKCPVWTSAHVAEAPVPPAGYRNVLCAVDLSPKSLALVEWAAGFAHEQAATVTLMHAIPAAKPPDGIDIEGDRFRASLFEMVNEELAKLQEQAGTNFETIPEPDDVAPAVRRVAGQINADLVLIGRGVMHATLGRMRTHVYSIIRDAPCPVISV